MKDTSSVQQHSQWNPQKLISQRKCAGASALQCFSIQMFYFCDSWRRCHPTKCWTASSFLSNSYWLTLVVFGTQCYCDSRFKVLGTGNKKKLNKIKLLIMFLSSAAAASSYVKIDASILLWQKPCYLLSPNLTAITTNAAAFITTHTVATAIKLDSNHFY